MVLKLTADEARRLGINIANEGEPQEKKPRQATGYATVRCYRCKVTEGALHWCGENGVQLPPDAPDWARFICRPCGGTLGLLPTKGAG